MKTGLLLGILFGFTTAHAEIEAVHQPIVNGTRTPQALTLTPRQDLAIGWLYGPSQPSVPFCSGILIRPGWVATAAHCTIDRPNGATGYGLGADPENPSALHAVQAVYTHPERDLALMALAEPVTAADPIPWVPDVTALENPVLEAAGYGDTKDDARDGRWFVVLRLVEITDTHVVVSGDDERGICHGDSGGPLLTMVDGSPQVLGVEQSGSNTCVGEDLLTRLDVVAPWLETVMGGTVTEDPEPEGCADFSTDGVCDGTTARWCDADGVPAARDCANDEQICGWTGPDFGNYCLEGKLPVIKIQGGGCVLQPQSSDFWPALLGVLLTFGLRRRFT